MVKFKKNYIVGFYFKLNTFKPAHRSFDLKRIQSDVDDYAY